MTTNAHNMMIGLIHAYINDSKNEKLYDIQAGFRKGKGTIDNIFVLQCLVDKYLGKEKGRF